MTVALRRPTYEPQEADDPRNAMLDLVEANIEIAIGQGLEPQIRARLARLLPPDPCRACAEAAARPAPPVVALPEAVDLAAVLTACKATERLRLQASQHAAIARLRGWIVATLAIVNARAGDAA
jgi:hypothetical protein